MIKRKALFIVAPLAALLLASCSGGAQEEAAAPVGDANHLKVVASTTQICDYTSEIMSNGDFGTIVHDPTGKVSKSNEDKDQQIELTCLLAPNASAHDHEMTREQMSALSEADLLLVNGVDLEHFLDDAIESSGFKGTLVGQVIRIQGLGGPVGELFLPLHGAHMAHNAALAVAAVESFLGGQGLSPEVIEEGLAEVKAPARLELVRTSPAVVIDTAHNPQAARATVDACREAYAFTSTIGVVAMMADKDQATVLETFAELMDQVVITEARGTPRALPTAELAALAEEIWSAGAVHQAPTMADALELATLLADAAGPGAGVLVAGSLIAAGQARDLLKQ